MGFNRNISFDAFVLITIITKMFFFVFLASEIDNAMFCVVLDASPVDSIAFPSFIPDKQCFD